VTADVNIVAVVVVVPTKVADAIERNYGLRHK
jgi:hypothetical protein